MFAYVYIELKCVITVVRNHCCFVRVNLVLLKCKALVSKGAVPW